MEEAAITISASSSFWRRAAGRQKKNCWMACRAAVAAWCSACFVSSCRMKSNNSIYISLFSFIAFFLNFSCAIDEMFDWFEWIQLVLFVCLSSLCGALGALRPITHKEKKTTKPISSSINLQWNSSQSNKNDFYLNELDCSLGPLAPPKTKQINSSFLILKEKRRLIVALFSRGRLICSISLQSARFFLRKWKN